MKIQLSYCLKGNFKIIYLNFLIYFLLPFSVVSQNYTLIGDRAFGTIGGETDPIIFRYNEKILIAGNSSYTGINGDKTELSCSTTPPEVDVWMLMVDDGLQIIWDKTIGGLEYDEIHGLEYGTNNSIAFSGETFSDSSCDISTTTRGGYDYWFCMLDSNGNKLLDNRYGSTNGERGGKLIRSSTKEYLVFGGSSGGISGDKTTPGYGGIDYWLVKTDSAGNKLWDKTYGGSNNELVSFRTNYFFQNIKNDQYLIGGSTNSPASGTISSNGFGYSDAWVAKLDSAGNIIWDNRFGGSDLEITSKIIEVNDGYLLLGGSTSKTGGTISDTGIVAYDVWIVKIDTAGNQLWEKRYGGIATDVGVDIQEAPDGGFWILANTNSPAGYDISENSYGDSDYWVIKIDSAGNKLWDKRFGGPGLEYANNFIILPDSSIYVIGYSEPGTSPVKTDSGRGGYDYWVVHFNYYNNTTGIQNLSSANGVSISPNPAKSMVSIKGLPNIRLETSLLGMDGRLINQQRIQGGQEVNYTMEDVSPGMYLLRFTGGQFIATVKVVKK